MNRDYKIGLKEYSQGQVVNIEDLLAQLYGITGAKCKNKKGRGWHTK
jgi:hypothetical protein